MSTRAKTKKKRKPNPCPSSHGCSNEATEEAHGCPYQEEINDDYEYACECCSDCAGECACEI